MRQCRHHTLLSRGAVIATRSRMYTGISTQTINMMMYRSGTCTCTLLCCYFDGKSDVISTDKNTCTCSMPEHTKHQSPNMGCCFLMPYPTRFSDQSHVSGKYVLTSTAGLKASGLAPRPGTTSTLLSMSTASIATRQMTSC